jgi:uncharacterized protein YqgC (DUF456 family)
LRVDVLLWILGAVLVVVGLIGIVVPALPGTVLVFAGLLMVAWADDFQRVGIPTLAVIGAVAALSYGVDFLAAALGAQHLGASRRAMAGAALGTLFGLFLGLPGVIIGPFVGAMLGELTVVNDLRKASRAGLAAWIGFAVGMAVKVGVVFVMVGTFVVALLF